MVIGYEQQVLVYAAGIRFYKYKTFSLLWLKCLPILRNVRKPSTVKAIVTLPTQFTTYKKNDVIFRKVPIEIKFRQYF